MANAGKVTDPNKKGGAGFLWGIVALLLIVAVVIGYIVWNGQRTRAGDVEDVAFDVSYSDGVVTLASPDANPSTPSAELFEDFSCPHCADLAMQTDEQMKSAIEAGDLVVNLRLLNFLDGQDIANNNGHSTQAIAAVIPLAEAGDAKAFWNLHKNLLFNQQKVRAWTTADFANAAKSYGAGSEEVKKIEEGDLATGQQIAKTNYDYLQETTGGVSSPRVLVNGKDIPDGQLNNWVDYVTGAAK